jgi:putative methylase
MRKKELELILERLCPVEKPKVGLEQYTIPAYLAAEILNLALLSGDIEGKVVFDLGCGSGRLAIGAAFLGARRVVGIDIDADAIRQAKKNVKIAQTISGRRLNVKFLVRDVSGWNKKCDTVLQNPPFGIKNSCGDRIFLERALAIAKKVYSLHRDGREETRNFLKHYIERMNGRIERIVKMEFFLPQIFKFHKKPKVRYDVDLYVINTH